MYLTDDEFAVIDRAIQNRYGVVKRRDDLYILWHGSTGTHYRSLSALREAVDKGPKRGRASSTTLTLKRISEECQTCYRILLEEVVVTGAYGGLYGDDKLGWLFPHSHSNGCSLDPSRLDKTSSRAIEFRIYEPLRLEALRRRQTSYEGGGTMRSIEPENSGATMSKHHVLGAETPEGWISLCKTKKVRYSESLGRFDINHTSVCRLCVKLLEEGELGVELG